jgi:hypothetical protein
MPEKSNGTKRYSLALPQKLFDELTEIAETNGLPIVDLMRGCFKVGVLAYKVQETSGSALVCQRRWIQGCFQAVENGIKIQLIEPSS